MIKIDILLPIYNSFEETKDCIESIIRYTNKDLYNLYLLDDNSSDTRIQELTSYYEKKKNISVIRNQFNLGFPGNVNNGFRKSSNDVIILNSDTVVSEDWLNNLKSVAYSDDKIAAVNPLSNYGNISSIPTTNASINDLFSFNELVTSFQKCKEIGFIFSPILIGYCMYIKRSALQTVGYFDAETFQRGYGEEIDWCYRSRKHGLKLAVSLGSYVHHVGGTSFGEEKEGLRINAGKILLKRYPENQEEIVMYVKQNKLRHIRRKMLKELNFVKKESTISLKIKMLKHYFFSF